MTNRNKITDCRFFCHKRTIPDRHSSRGSVMVLVALGLTVFLGLCALVTDLGMLYVAKARLQNAVDAAALAGAQDLPDNPSQAKQFAQDYAEKNNTLNSTIQIGDNDSTITVSAQRTTPTYFAKIWGINSQQISAKATAVAVPPPSLKNAAAPLCIQDQKFDYGALYALKTGPLTPTSASGGHYYGWFGPLDLGGIGGGSSDYINQLEYGYSGNLSMGQVVDLKNGNMSGPTMQAVNFRLAEDTSVPPNTWDNYVRNAPEIIYIPVVKVVNSDKNAVYQVQVLGFAAFFLESAGGNGNDSIISGRFIRTLIPGDKTGGTLADLLKQEQNMESGNSSSDYGLYTPKLVNN